MADQDQKILQGISTLKLDKYEKQSYEWIFNIPPFSRMTEHASVLGPEYSFEDLKFTTGAISKLDHSLSVYFDIDSPSIYAQLNIKESSTRTAAFVINSSEIQTLREGQEQGTFPVTFEKKNYRIDGPIKSYDWISSQSIPEDKWDDSVDALKLILNVHYEEVPTIVNLPVSAEKSIDHKSKVPTEFNRKKYYLSESFSDVMILIKNGEKLPAHRLVLSERSPVLERMFTNDMKESKEGIVEIDDIEPDVFKEMLHYIYTGEVTGDKALSSDLLKAADKYALEDLKAKCAVQIAKTIVPGNAIEMFILGDTYNEPDLMRTAKNVIKLNKLEALKDAETVRELANRYPDLIFEIITN